MMNSKFLQNYLWRRTSYSGLVLLLSGLTLGQILSSRQKNMYYAPDSEDLALSSNL